MIISCVSLAYVLSCRVINGVNVHISSLLLTLLPANRTHLVDDFDSKLAV